MQREIYWFKTHLPYKFITAHDSVGGRNGNLTLLATTVLLRLLFGAIFSTSGTPYKDETYYDSKFIITVKLRSKA